MKRAPLYIETKIKCDIEDIWKCTQSPELHQQWDLRFSKIKYLPKESPELPQKFSYETKLGFGIKVAGLGESIVSVEKENGTRISSLKFWSNAAISIIKEGGGFWKYIPETNGIRFFTKYDYQTRWGFLGSIFDKVIFRPLMVWATAWSFDCLKNWLEKNISPRTAILSFRTCLIVNIILGIIWIYQGLVPKLLFPNAGELNLIENLGILNGNESLAIAIIGICEIVFGALFLLPPRKWLYWFNILILTILGFGAIISTPSVFVAPFNPFSLNISMIGLSLIGLVALHWLPNASNCVTREPK